MSPPASTSEVSAAVPAPPCVLVPEGHEAWFKDQVYAHDSSLKAYLRRQYPGVQDVDDVVQESYLRIWKAKLAQRIEHSKSFLFSVARNLALDLVRRGTRSPFAQLPDYAASLVLDDKPGVAETAAKHDDLDLLAKAIDALPEKCRRVMIHRQIEGLSQKEIAAKLGIAEQTVQTHVVVGLRRIEAFVEQRGGTER